MVNFFNLSSSPVTCTESLVDLPHSKKLKNETNDLGKTVSMPFQNTNLAPKNVEKKYQKLIGDKPTCTATKVNKKSTSILATDSEDYLKICNKLHISEDELLEILNTPPDWQKKEVAGVKMSSEVLNALCNLHPIHRFFENENKRINE